MIVHSAQFSLLFISDLSLRVVVFPVFFKNYLQQFLEIFGKSRIISESKVISYLT